MVQERVENISVVMGSMSVEAPTPGNLSTSSMSPSLSIALTSGNSCNELAYEALREASLMSAAPTIAQSPASEDKKHLKNVGPIRHCESPHAHSPGVASGTVARRLRIDVHDDNDNDDNNDNDNDNA